MFQVFTKRFSGFYIAEPLNNVGL